MSGIKIILDPPKRREYLDGLLALDGLSHIKEDPAAAYCPVSLTSTPDELKEVVRARQQILVEKVLKPAGITAYDPESAPFSPDKNISARPDKIYAVDSSKIAGTRFFVGHNILPSTGAGVEAEKAKIYNRVAVMLMDKNVRVSRMQPNRTIYLEYSDFSAQAGRFAEVFELLMKYEPGAGLNGDLPALLGFDKTTGEVADLEQVVYEKFADLRYHYDGNTPVLKLRAENPEIFRENRG
ncbi:MAG: hypothetical protein CVU77_02715 [Elusimicrobia bacterium HGW-Elusimicrobia-1]|jgi:hypothetical protein|nr:MAG: hypothetical protein CVU77_02715 [Elusimicrobia bacterium HGW-Elusimicrobia-1]